MNRLSVVSDYHFRIDRILLNRHFQIKDRDNCSVLSWSSVASDFAKQLLGQRSSDFNSGRVPLYLCPCGDVYCGALTVAIDWGQEQVTWSDFGWEGPESEGVSQSLYMTRTGPFVFEREEYRAALSGYL